MAKTIEEDVDLTAIQKGVRTEVKRLTRYRLHESIDDTNVALRHLAKAGVLRKPFTEFLQRLLKASAGDVGNTSRAMDALAILRLYPNRTFAMRHS